MSKTRMDSAFPLWCCAKLAGCWGLVLQEGMLTVCFCCVESVKKVWIVLAVVLALVTPSALATPSRKAVPRKPVSAVVQPYTIKGYRLGMTLEEFRAVKLSDKEAEYVPFSSAEERGEEAIMRGTDVSNATNISTGLTCVYKMPSGSRWKVAPMTIATAPMDHLEFDFILAPDGKYRLYEIDGTFYNGLHFLTLWNGFKAKFGEPTKLETEYLQNGFGAEFESLTLIWSNSVSSIELRKCFYDADKGALWCRHKALYALQQKLSTPKPGKDL